MQAKNNSPQCSEPTFFLENPENYLLKSKRRRATKQFDLFLISSTKIMDDFFQFRQKIDEFEALETQKSNQFERKYSERHQKCFVEGPLPLIQYINVQENDQKSLPRIEDNIILNEQPDSRCIRSQNIFKQR